MLVILEETGRFKALEMTINAMKYINVSMKQS